MIIVVLHHVCFLFHKRFWIVLTLAIAALNREMVMQVTAMLSLAAACSSAGVIVLLLKDTNICRLDAKLSCNKYQISVALAFVSWFLLGISSYVMLWLAASA